MSLQCLLLLCVWQVSVLDDPTFQERKTQAIIQLNGYLADSHGIAVKELMEANDTLDDEIVVYVEEVNKEVKCEALF